MKSIIKINVVKVLGKRVGFFLEGIGRVLWKSVM